jgi:hypothetical protein
MQTLKLFIRHRAPLPAPAHFPSEPSDFRELWDELDAALRPNVAHTTEMEMATLLIADMRRNGPDWPADRFRLLVDLVRGIRP